MSWWNSPRVWRLPHQSLAAAKLEVDNHQRCEEAKEEDEEEGGRGKWVGAGGRRREREKESARNQTTPPWRVGNTQANKQTNKRSNSHNTYFINYIDYGLWIELLMECDHMSWTIPRAADNANSNGQYVHCSRWAAPEHDPAQAVTHMPLRQGHARPKSGAWEPRHATPFGTI